MSTHWQKAARKPLIIGALLGVLTIIMLFLSAKALMQYDEMEPLRAAAVVVEGGKVLPENEGKLVLVSGPVTFAGSTVSDGEFDLTVDAPYLARHVEMRQWQNSFSRGSDSGKAEAVWWPALLPDQEINGRWYRNPGSMPFDGAGFFADAPVMLGEFALSKTLFAKLIDLPGRFTRVVDLPQSGADKNGLTLDEANSQYYYESDFGWGVAGAQGIGDVRVFFDMADPSKLGVITVMAQQQNGTLTIYHEGISYIEHLYDGIMGKDEVLAAEKTTDTYGSIAAVGISALLLLFTALNLRRVIKIKKEYERRADRGY